MASTTNYDESSFRVLKGLEPVRERPGMYTRTDSPAHIIQEVIDNAADEALAGSAKKIQVTAHRDGAITVADDGRGIPVGLHPEEGVPVVVLAYTRLHAGGKFNKREGNSAYAFSGGLHGVGVAVTNALSLSIEVEIKRDGKVHRIVFANGGERIGPLEEIGTCGQRNTGTTVKVWPDPKYFDVPRVPMNELERLLRSKAVLLPGVAVQLDVEQADGSVISKQWHYPGGLAQYLSELAGDQEPVAPLFTGEKYAASDDEAFASGEGAAWTFGWFDPAVPAESYVNLIPTVAGGTHESGLRAGVFEAVKSFIEHHALLPRGLKLQQDDACSRLSFVLSARLLDPQFQGQVKEKLNSREAVKLVSGMVRDPFEIWLNNHVDAGKAIAELAIRAATARQKNAKKVEKKKTSGVAVLPGKLSDCESEDIDQNELFLVEGDSAGGSAKLARNKETQAILPLRGKVMNAWEIDPDRLYANNEIHDIAVALGVDAHGPKDTPDLSSLRYGKVVIMSDADVDGAHIQTLLLTLFFRHFPKLIEAGHIYVAQPPLYRVDVPAQGKKRPARRLYALDDGELTAIRDRTLQEGFKPESLEIGRFKGLGEMNPEQLRETTMDPATRRVLPVQVRADALDDTLRMFTLLMGKGEASNRRAWMETKGDTVDADL
ncbi:DNA topoisomerase IV subunit B [Denitromonas ohlonensis]|uniref:DNA topoisomerase 4 subunit B n=2 Tax=Denitromonas TaxID=139331 RepID=A0A557RD63_9RHOO|nr:DNA topoisomerase IV subunit B [Denitromonas ohlonensis]TVO63104.1 type IIA DNA topoisomerase subunit B [Denitromonas ohlonensis]TVO73645.1 type IIA DNA topoisomerase subunit B [Denitromonas ohlonensis]